jgi:hypothetical protein
MVFGGIQFSIGFLLCLFVARFGGAYPLVAFLLGTAVGMGNLIAGAHRIGASRRILAKDPSVPDAFIGDGWLILRAACNVLCALMLFLLWPLLLFVATGLYIDLHVRRVVLSHRHLFEESLQIQAFAYVAPAEPQNDTGPPGGRIWVYRTPTGPAFIDQNFHCALVEAWETSYFATARDCAAYLRREFDFPEVTDPGERQRLIADHQRVLDALRQRFA